MVGIGKIQTRTKGIEWSDIPTRIVGGGIEDNRIELEDYLLYLFEDKGAIEVIEEERNIMVKRYVVNPLKKKLIEIAMSIGDIGVHQMYLKVNNKFNTSLSLDFVYNTVIKKGAFIFRYSIGFDENGKIVAKETEYKLEHSDPEVNQLLKELVESIIKPQLDKLMEYISNLAQEHNLRVMVNLAYRGMGVETLEVFWFDSDSLEQFRHIKEGGYISPDEVNEVYEKLQKELSPNQKIRITKYIPAIL